MSQAPAMPVFTDALIGDTTHLTAEEFGAYCLILFATWRNNGVPFDDDNMRLCRIARIEPRRWARVRPVLVKFFDLSDGKWNQKRLEKEWIRTQNLISIRRQKGMAGAEARWLKTQETDDSSGTALSNGPANGTSNAQRYGNHNHNHNNTPNPINGASVLIPKNSRAYRTNPRAEGRNPRAIADPYNLAGLDMTQLMQRFREATYQSDEREAIRDAMGKLG